MLLPIPRYVTAKRLTITMIVVWVESAIVAGIPYDDNFKKLPFGLKPLPYLNRTALCSELGSDKIHYMVYYSINVFLPTSLTVLLLIRTVMHSVSRRIDH